MHIFSPGGGGSGAAAEIWHTKRRTGAAFSRGHEEGTTAGTFSWIQILNPAASGVQRSGSYMAHYLVTGGAGFIGSNIVQALLERGQTVRVLDNFATGRRENLAEFASRIELIEGDFRDVATAERAVEGVDYVLHQAALGSVPRSVQNPLTSNDVNVNGTLNLLWAAHQARVKCFVTASSSSVYGNAQQLPKEESQLP